MLVPIPAIIVCMVEPPTAAIAPARKPFTSLGVLAMRPMTAKFMMMASRNSTGPLGLSENPMARRIFEMMTHIGVNIATSSIPMKMPRGIFERLGKRHASIASGAKM